MFARGRFSEDVKMVPILSALTSAANSDRTSEVIDTDGFDGVCVVVHVGSVAASAVQDVYLTSSDVADDENTLNSGSNVADSSQTIADDDDDELKYMDFVPDKRYYQLVVNKDGTNASNESAVAYLYKASDKPVTHAGGTATVGDGTEPVSGEWLGVATQGTK